MARTVEVICDRCGHMDAEKGGSTDWITYRQSKVKKDFCSAGCATKWIAEQPKQMRLEAAG